MQEKRTDVHANNENLDIFLENEKELKYRIIVKYLIDTGRNSDIASIYQKDIDAMRPVRVQAPTVLEGFSEL
jgi:hypothetical protein